MSTFILSQANPISEKRYIYPNADLSGCTAWEAIGEPLNYQCIDDERGSIDYDTYVTMDASAYKTDLYGLETVAVFGTSINFIKAHCTIKSEYMLDEVGKFYITCSPDSVCTHVYNSDEKPLLNTWTKVTNVWSKNPQTDSAWEFSDINNLSLGFKARSSMAYSSNTKYAVLRPNGVGSVSDLIPVGDAPNWKCVDEVKPDDNTYVYTSVLGVNRRDAYNIEYNSVLNGKNITGVTLYGYSKGATGAHDKLTLALTSGASDYWGASFELTTNYASFQETYAVNPWTSKSWATDIINTLQIGPRLFKLGSYHPRCSQVFAVVTWDDSPIPSPKELANANLDVAQCYLEIDYMPLPRTATLNKPEVIDIGTESTIKMLNFWNGNREVYSLSRSNKTMVMTGKEFYHSTCTNPGTRINNVRELGINGANIAIDSLDMACYNGTYKIASFGWKLTSKKPEIYEWIIQLEDTEL